LWEIESFFTKQADPPSYENLDNSTCDQGCETTGYDTPEMITMAAEQKFSTSANYV